MQKYPIGKEIKGIGYSGNVLSTYESVPITGTTLLNRQKEINLYGSSRLGIFNVNIPSGIMSTPLPPQNAIGFKIPTKFHYEISNLACRIIIQQDHLGNVLTTITGRKTPVFASESIPGSNPMHLLSHYAPEVVSNVDYNPFGSEMPGRSYTNTTLLGTKSYRYGFNAKEIDKSGEIGSLTHYDYGFRIYNPSIGKFLSVDPLTKDYAMLTPYQFASNRPIDGVDLDGLEYNDSKLSIVLSDKASKIKVNGRLDVSIKILNLTKKPISAESKNFHSQKSSATFDNLNEIYFSEIINLHPKTGKALAKRMNIEAKIDIDFKFIGEIKSLEEIKNGDVILVLVGSLPNIDSETSKGGQASRGGHAYIMDIDAFNSKDHIDTHEKAHLIGDLNDMKEKDAPKGYLMSYNDDGKGYELTNKQKRYIVENILYQIGFKKIKGEPNTKQEVKDLMIENKITIPKK